MSFCLSQSQQRIQWDKYERWKVVFLPSHRCGDTFCLTKEPQGKGKENGWNSLFSATLIRASQERKRIIWSSSITRWVWQLLTDASKMKSFLWLCLSLSVAVNARSACDDVDFVDRNGWGANPPKAITNLTRKPLSYYVIHHTYQPPKSVLSTWRDVE